MSVSVMFCSKVALCEEYLPMSVSAVFCSKVALCDKVICLV